MQSSLCGEVEARLTAASIQADVKCDGQDVTITAPKGLAQTAVLAVADVPGLSSVRFAEATQAAASPASSTTSTAMPSSAATPTLSAPAASGSSKPDVSRSGSSGSSAGRPSESSSSSSPVVAAPKSPLTVSFNGGSAKLAASQTGPLKDVVAYLVANPDASVAVAGHTDSGLDESSRQELSLKRAKAVRAYLVSKGVAEGQISVAGKSDSDPVASNDTAKGRAANRRAVITIQGDN